MFKYGIKFGIMLGATYFASSWFLSRFFPSKLKYHLQFGKYGKDTMWWWLKGKIVSANEFEKLTDFKPHFITFENSDSLKNYYNEKSFFNVAIPPKLDKYNVYTDTIKIDWLSYSTLLYTQDNKIEKISQLPYPLNNGNYEIDYLNSDNNGFIIIDDQFNYYYRDEYYNKRQPILNTTKFAYITVKGNVKIIKEGLYSARKIYVWYIENIYDHPWIKRNFMTIVDDIKTEDVNEKKMKELYKFMDHTEELVFKIFERGQLNYELDVTKISKEIWIKLLKEYPKSVHINKNSYVKLDPEVKIIMMKYNKSRSTEKIYHDYSMYNDNIEAFKRDLEYYYNSKDRIHIYMRYRLLLKYINEECLKGLGGWLYNNDHFNKFYKYIPEKLRINIPREAYCNLIYKYGYKINLKYVPKKYHTQELYEYILNSNSNWDEYFTRRKFLKAIDFDIVDEKFCYKIMHKIDGAKKYIPKDKCSNYLSSIEIKAESLTNFLFIN